MNAERDRNHFFLGLPPIPSLPNKRQRCAFWSLVISSSLTLARSTVSPRAFTRDRRCCRLPSACGVLLAVLDAKGRESVFAREGVEGPFVGEEERRPVPAARERIPNDEEVGPGEEGGAELGGMEDELGAALLPPGPPLRPPKSLAAELLGFSRLALAVALASRRRAASSAMIRRIYASSSGSSFESSAPPCGRDAAERTGDDSSSNMMADEELNP